MAVQPHQLHLRADLKWLPFWVFLFAHCEITAWILEHSLWSVPLSYFHSFVAQSTSKTSVHVTQELLWTPLKQILPTKMSYSANLKNVMSMETSQRSTENEPLAEQELEASKPGPSPHDLAAQLKSSLLAEIGLTESDGPPLSTFRYPTPVCALWCWFSEGGTLMFAGLCRHFNIIFYIYIY